MTECLTKKRNYCVNEIYSQPVITTTSGLTGLSSAHDYAFTYNPVEYTDPDGKTINIDFTDDITQSERNSFNAEIEKIKSSDTEAGKRYRDIEESKDITVNIKVTKEGKIQTEILNPENSRNGTGSDSDVNINLNEIGRMIPGSRSLVTTGAALAHEVGGHAYHNAKGTSAVRPTTNSTGRHLEEQRATAVENQYRAKMEPGLGRNQRDTYSFWDNRIIDTPRYSTRTESWFLNGKPWNLR